MACIVEGLASCAYARRVCPKRIFADLVWWVCVCEGRLISTQPAVASVQFPVPNPAKRKTGRDAGFGDKKLQHWLALASLFTHFTKSFGCVEFVSPSAGETWSSSGVAVERRRRTERRYVVAAVRPSCLGVLHSFLRGLSQRWRFRRCGWERGSLLQERLQVECVLCITG